jgi:hypothetical protein
MIMYLAGNTGGGGASERRILFLRQKEANRLFSYWDIMSGRVQIHREPMFKERRSCEDSLILGQPRQKKNVS